MATVSATKKPENKEPKPAGQEMHARKDGAVLLSRMRDEVDRMFHRMTKNLPHLWEIGGSTCAGAWTCRKKKTASSSLPRRPDSKRPTSTFRSRIIAWSCASHKSEISEKDGRKVEGRECYQSITLPCEVNKQKVEATYHNGVLTVTMPKSAQAKGEARFRESSRKSSRVISAFSKR